MDKIGVVDIFSGPGGLGEGFAGFTQNDGCKPFQVVLSVEKDAAAYETLRLRSFLRQFENMPDEYYRYLNGLSSEEPDWGELYPDEWHQSGEEAWHFELGVQSTWPRLSERIKDIKEQYAGRTILLGGPPCQAYSLVGRSRNARNEGYNLQKDERIHLYREYVEVLATLHPLAFILENVKGLLSFRTQEGLVWDQIVRELEEEGYRLIPLAGEYGLREDCEPVSSDFVVKTESYGIPQRRHRVIIVGVRQDLGAESIKESVSLDLSNELVNVESVLGDMPKLRSRLSRQDSTEGWLNAVKGAIVDIEGDLSRNTEIDPEGDLLRCLGEVKHAFDAQTNKFYQVEVSNGKSHVEFLLDCPGDLRDWIVDKRLSRLPNHEARSHMPSDLARYLYAAVFAQAHNHPPKAQDFPAFLAPNHKNWGTGKFNDRFRVQENHRPASTITSHIAKDGHYYIHPDPIQCRSLTVREAARSHTFPDNYLIIGNRTQQDTQVGTAVPLFLACQIGEKLWNTLA